MLSIKSIFNNSPCFCQAEEHIGELEKKLTDQKEDYDLMVARWEAEDRGDGNRDRLVQGDMEQLSQER